MQHTATRHITAWIYHHQGKSWYSLKSANRCKKCLIWSDSKWIWCWGEIWQCGTWDLSSPNGSVPEFAEANTYLSWISREFGLGGASEKPHGIAHTYLSAEPCWDGWRLPYPNVHPSPAAEWHLYPQPRPPTSSEPGPWCKPAGYDGTRLRWGSGTLSRGGNLMKAL